MSDLIREEVIRANAQWSSIIGSPTITSPLRASLWWSILILLVSFAGSLCLLGQYRDRAEVAGVVAPVGEASAAVALPGKAGSVTSVAVQIGQHVSIGDKVLTYTTAGDAKSARPTSIYSPVTGIVAKVYVSPGQEFLPGQPATLIEHVVPDHLGAYFAVPDEIASQLHEKDDVLLRELLPDPSESPRLLRGRIERVWLKELDANVLADASDGRAGHSQYFVEVRLEDVGDSVWETSARRIRPRVIASFLLKSKSLFTLM